MYMSMLPWLELTVQGHGLDKAQLQRLPEALQQLYVLTERGYYEAELTDDQRELLDKFFLIDDINRLLKGNAFSGMEHIHPELTPFYYSQREDTPYQPITRYYPRPLSPVIERQLQQLRDTSIEQITEALETGDIRVKHQSPGFPQYSRWY